MTLPPGLGDLLLLLLALSATALVAAAVLGLLLWRRLKRLKVAPGTGFWDTLRQVPFGLVVLLDLLDLALDVFSSPIIWVLLDRLRLKQLRDVATVEALIPITGPIPLMTLCWIVARLTRIGRTPGGGDVLEGEEVGPGKWRPRA